MNEKDSQTQHLAAGAEEVILKHALTCNAVKIQQNGQSRIGKLQFYFNGRKVRIATISLAEFQSQQSSICCLRHALAAADQDSR